MAELKGDGASGGQNDGQNATTRLLHGFLCFFEGGRKRLLDVREANEREKHFAPKYIVVFDHRQSDLALEIRIPWPSR
jgi:hypothetical protein